MKNGINEMLGKCHVEIPESKESGGCRPLFKGGGIKKNIWTGEFNRMQRETRFCRINCVLGTGEMREQGCTGWG